MEMNIGWPEGIYLVLNVLCLALMVFTQSAKGALWGAVIWLFVTFPLLIWGWFFA